MTSPQRLSLPLADAPEPGYRPPELLLILGNGKLGEAIHHFSLPALETCPGISPICSRHCYALNIYARRPPVLARHQRNLDALENLNDFRERMIAEIRCRCVRSLRWHVAGDVFSVEYAKALLAVMTSSPSVQHFFYTRSWRVRSLCPWLARMAQLPNVSVWYSLDATTGFPRSIPPGVRLAWMAVRLDEEERFAHRIQRCDLVFLNHPLRRMRLRRFAGVRICPQESDPNVTCSVCRFCLPHLNETT